jgi:hypothetical protein
MKAIGQIKIENNLELKNPTLSINRVTYDWQNDSVRIEILFNEEGSKYQHSRDYIFSNSVGDSLSSTDIYNFIKSHNTLKVFE